MPTEILKLTRSICQKKMAEGKGTQMTQIFLT